ncbi:probable polyamine transporter At3g13620 [Syzygium oleosum]|uniref:probable polyamine transporter At3g13620 n=1 Tax=Syzygium oleosum TaxID=219896 RepID=UPI0024B8E285|nr:probable polyamine transporter At3g13620 [Syzygium oleosum]
MSPEIHSSRNLGPLSSPQKPPKGQEPAQRNPSAELPITTAAAAPAASASKKLTLVPLIFLIYFEVAGGPYGEEPAVQAGGPLLALLGFSIFPFIWSVPEALITAELSTAFPGNGGFVIWADRAFGPFFGSLMGTWKFLSGVINIAAFPVLCIDYLEKIFSVFESGCPRYLALLFSNLSLSFLNYTGLNVVGVAGIVLGVVSLMPFLLMSLIAIPKIRPHRWGSLGQKGVKKDWNLFFNTLFWNLNFWDNVSTVAGEVDKPQKNFPLALLVAVIFTCVSYLIPLFAVTGAVSVDQSEWESGFHAIAAEMIAGKWLKVWIEVGAVLSAIGLFEAQLSSSAYQVLGMADIGILPEFFAVRSKWFGTPWVGILLSSLISIGVSYMDFTDIVSSANFLYSLGMLLEFAAFIWLRRKLPSLKRPYRVPLGVPGLVVMCLIPSAFLVVIMVIATKVVYLVSGLMTLGGIGWFFLMKFCKSRKIFKFDISDVEVAQD